MQEQTNNLPPMISSPSSASRSLILLLTGGFMAMAVIVLFYLFDPVKHSFFPLCVFHQFTGLNCPGCGGQRALHYLLHGEIGAALRCNALVLVAIPVAIWITLRWGARRFSNRELPKLFRHHIWAWVLGGVVILFGVVRNLPSFAWLSP